MSRFRQILAALLMATLLLNVPAAAWENDTHAADVVAAALAEPKIARLAEGMTLVKSIVVKGKLVSLIFKPQ